MDPNETASPDNGDAPTRPLRTFEPPTFIPLGTAQEAIASFQSFTFP